MNLHFPNYKNQELVEIKVALFKAQTLIPSKAITLWTKAHKPHNYSHTEIVFSSAIYFGHDVESQTIKFKDKPDTTEEVDYYIIKIPKELEQTAFQFAQDHDGAKYDWLGITMTQFINLGMNSTYKWFCSEIVVRLLQIMGFYPLFEEQAHKISPYGLHKRLDLLAQKFPQYVRFQKGDY